MDISHSLHQFFFGTGGSGDMSVYLTGACFIGLILGVVWAFVIFVSGIESDWPFDNFDEGARWFSLSLLAPFLWPLPVLAAPFVGLFFMARAWLRLIPSKEQRIAKAENTVNKLKGEVNA